jgi:hypothetical protein
MIRTSSHYKWITMDFSGLVENLSYINGSCDFWDNCDIDTFSLIWIHDFIKFFRNEITERLHVYWCMPGKDFMDVLFYTVNDAHILAITTIAKKYTNLCIFIDHTKFLEGLRDDVVINGRTLPHVITLRKFQRLLEISLLQRVECEDF